MMTGSELFDQSIDHRAPRVHQYDIGIHGGSQPIVLFEFIGNGRIHAIDHNRLEIFLD
jgi:hypothetical protein